MSKGVVTYNEVNRGVSCEDTKLGYKSAFFFFFKQKTENEIQERLVGSEMFIRDKTSQEKERKNLKCILLSEKKKRLKKKKKKKPDP